jgi:hypothetical protein
MHFQPTNQPTNQQISNPSFPPKVLATAMFTATLENLQYSTWHIPKCQHHTFLGTMLSMYIPTLFQKKPTGVK